ncbi:hypothetical protein EJ06DRAFT_556795 [Trichodelitschia bisporula]|uniref:Uncharacterized protein n=1 Tax=Trichodelitschia bisporula TaxID=703511 RepID=A0A6G1HXN1_9PEZI|nr:hypothetical protein EJ06DRAFT_556795 [Trichodelitschia bisporula]
MFSIARASIERLSPRSRRASEASQRPHKISKLRTLLSSPIAVGTFQATLLGVISNVVAQAIGLYRAKITDFDPIEILRFALFNLLISPPVFWWQVWLEDTFPGFYEPVTEDTEPTLPLDELNRDTDADLNADVEHAAPLMGPAAAEASAKPRLHITYLVIKVVLDCTFGALWYNTVFLVLMSVLKGFSAGQVWEAVRTETLPMMLAGGLVWPLAAVINFVWIPVERRVVWYAAVGLIWGIYISGVSLGMGG